MSERPIARNHHGISQATVQRRLARRPDRVLGVDDFTPRCGRIYGTVLLDMLGPVVVLPGGNDERRAQP